MKTVYKVVAKQKDGTLKSAWMSGSKNLKCLTITYPVGEWLANPTPMLVFETLNEAKEWLNFIKWYNNLVIYEASAVKMVTIESKVISINHNIQLKNAKALCLQLESLWKSYLKKDLNSPLMDYFYTQHFPKGTIGTTKIRLNKLID